MQKKRQIIPSINWYAVSHWMLTHPFQTLWFVCIALLAFTQWNLFLICAAPTMIWKSFHIWDVHQSKEEEGWTPIESTVVITLCLILIGSLALYIIGRGGEIPLPFSVLNPIHSGMVYALTAFYFVMFIFIGKLGEDGATHYHRLVAKLKRSADNWQSPDNSD